MGKIDDPFKQLIFAGKKAFIEWLAHQTVQSVRELPSELLKKTDPLRTDLLFEVTLADERKIIVHIEVQGRNSKPPMPIRELLYIALTVEQYQDVPIMSAVIYFGQGAGADDDGHHRVLHPNGSVTIEWHYDVIRLEDMTAEEIIALDQTDLLPLVVQTFIANPKEVIPPVITKIQQVVDPNRRHFLLKTLVQLTRSQEVYQVIEETIAIDDLYEDLYVVQKARKEGFTMGIEEGIEKGIEKGREEGREERRQLMRANILDILRFRFHATDAELNKIDVMLGVIRSLDELETCAHIARHAESLADFMAQMGSQ